MKGGIRAKKKTNWYGVSKESTSAHENIKSQFKLLITSCVSVRSKTWMHL